MRKLPQGHARSQDLCWEGCRLQALRLAPEKVSLRATKHSRQRVLSRHWDLECQGLPPAALQHRRVCFRASLGETIGGKSAATRGPPGWGRRHLLRPMNGVQCLGAVVSNTIFSCAGDPQPAPHCSATVGGKKSRTPTADPGGRWEPKGRRFIQPQGSRPSGPVASPHSAESPA